MKYIGKSEKKLVKKAKSGIKIKPENKGKFTATKKKTGKSTEELTHSKNPVTKKRAIFAQNAAKWNNGASKKAQGGTIEFLQPLIDAFKCGGLDLRRLAGCGDYGYRHKWGLRRSRSSLSLTQTCLSGY